MSAEQDVANLDREILQLTKELSTLKQEVGIPTPLTVSDPRGGFSLLACSFSGLHLSFPDAQ